MNWGVFEAGIGIYDGIVMSDVGMDGMIQVVVEILECLVWKLGIYCNHDCFSYFDCLLKLLSGINIIFYVHFFIYCYFEGNYVHN